MTGTAEEALLQYVGRFRKCFQYDKKDKSLSFYQETDTRLQLFTNEDQVEVAACNCAEGQAKLIATHNTGSGKWCGSKAPDPAKM